MVSIRFSKLSIVLCLLLDFSKTSSSQKCDTNGINCVSCTEYQTCDAGYPQSGMISCKRGDVCADEKLKTCQMKLNCQALNDCTEVGIFPDVMIDSNYFVCLSDGSDGFLKYDFNCQQSYFFDPSVLSCIPRDATPVDSTTDDVTTTPSTTTPTASSSTTTPSTTTSSSTTTPSTTTSSTTTPSTTTPTASSSTTTPSTTTSSSTTTPSTTTSSTTTPSTTTSSTTTPSTTTSSTTTPSTTTSSTTAPSTTASSTTSSSTTTPSATTSSSTTTPSTTTSSTTTPLTTTSSTTTPLTTASSTTTLLPTSPTPAPPFVCSSPGIFPSPDNCKIYYRCSTSLKQFLYICPGRSYFNENILKCSLLITPACREQILQNTTSAVLPVSSVTPISTTLPFTTTTSTPPTTTTTTTTTTSPQTTTTTTTSPPTTTTTTTTLPPTTPTASLTTTTLAPSTPFICLLPGTFESPTDCKIYYRCFTSGKVSRYECPGSTYFNEITKRCSLTPTTRCKQLIQG